MHSYYLLKLERIWNDRHELSQVVEGKATASIAIHFRVFIGMTTSHYLLCCSAICTTKWSNHSGTAFLAWPLSIGIR